MHLSRRTVTAWLLLLCVALLATRVAGSHLHLCFDGQEPPISFHSAAEEPHHPAEEATHSDQDVELPKTALAKWFSQGGETAALLFVAIFCGLLVLDRRSPKPVSSPVAAGLLLRLLRPPLRGPPLTLPS